MCARDNVISINSFQRFVCFSSRFSKFDAELDVQWLLRGSKEKQVAPGAAAHEMIEPELSFL